MLADAAKVFAAIATLMAFGYGLTMPLARDTPLDRFERLGIAYVLGTGAAAVLWALLMPLYGIVSPLVLISAIAWGIAGFAIGPVASGFSRTVAPVGSGVSRTRGPWAIGLTLLLVVELGVLTLASLQSGLGFDAVFNFEVKARIAFEHPTRGQIPLAFFSDESRVWSHPRYPLLVPFAEYWVYGWLGRIDQFFVKIIFPLFYASLVCVMAGTIRRLRGTVAALAAVSAMGTLPAITVIPGAISGYAEIPLAAAIAAAVGCTLLALSTGYPQMFWLAGALSAVAAWTKVEGGILAMCLAAAALRVAGRKALPLLVMPLTIVVLWTLFQQVYGLPEKDFPSLSPHVAIANLDRVPTIVRGVARELVTPGHWGLLWPAFALLCALALRARAWRDADLITAAVVVLPLCLYPVTYLFSGWEDVEGHVRTSFVRLLVPLVPMAIVFTAMQLWPVRQAAAKA